MSRYRIQCINKSDRFNPWERIAYVGGVDSNGARWRLDQPRAIQEIESHQWAFFVHRRGLDVDVVVAISAHGRKYLKTKPDGEHPDNLLELPECP